MKIKRITIIVTSALILIIAGIFISVVYIGVYDVGVPSRHNPVTEYLLKTTMRNSIKYRARYVDVPDSIDLRDRDYARNFFWHYNAACLPCHGAPGKDPDPWMILYPEAPVLTEKGVVDKWTDSELFLLLKNGIKSTGMMALGPTHPDDAIWGVTALVRQLPEMTPEEYEAMQIWFEQMQQQASHAE